jgi:3-methyladenine DNA glycosylase AlkD
MGKQGARKILVGEIMTAEDLKAALNTYAKTDDAVTLGRFFKTGEGQYSAGDIFIGVRVPDTRKVCKDFAVLPLGEITKLLASPIHEHRLAAVILLGNQFKKANAKQQEEIYDVYLAAVYAGQINNWDIVDTSAEFIVGEYLVEKPRGLLFELAASPNLWQRRVAVLSSFAFIKKGDASTTLKLAGLLLHDEQDLIQKAVGWMLREIGKRCDQLQLLKFLDTYAAEMPRTMLRYSIEHLTPAQKKMYMGAAKKAAS